MRTYIFLTNEAANKGYTTSVKALAATVQNPAIIDAVDLDSANISKDAVLVSAGNMGYELLKKYGTGHEMVFATDRYGFEDLNALNASRLTVIAPSCELAKYAKQTVTATYVKADLVACPTAKIMKEYAGHFISDNDPFVSNTIFEVKPSYYFFFGGRVSAPTADNPDNWKENSVEQFETMAQGIMEDAKGENLFFVFHGLRSRTRGNKTNDFAPQNAALDVMRRHRQKGQTVLVIATTEDGPAFIVMNDGEEKSVLINNANAGGYYMALWYAAQTSAFVGFTAEQMNLTNEAMTIGVDWKLLKPFGSTDGWNLTVEANEATHKEVFNLLEKGKTPMTQVEAFELL